MKTIFLICILSCFTAPVVIFLNQANTKQTTWQSMLVQPGETTVGTIHLPQGFQRMALYKDSFGEWLRNVCLRKDNTVRL